MRDPVDTIIKAYKGYLSKHGRRILSILEIAGQREVLTTVESLFWYHDPGTGYPKLMQAVEEILASDEHRRRLREQGLELVERGGVLYIRASAEVIRRMLGEARSLKAHSVESESCPDGSAGFKRSPAG